MPGFVLILLVMAVVAFVVAESGESKEAPGIYANGVFLTVDAPDVPPWAAELLGRMKTVHTAEELKSALDSGTRVVV